MLELLVRLGAEFGLTREDMSYASIRRITETYSSADDLERILRDSILAGREQECASSGITLPPLLWEEGQIYSFFMP